MHKILNVLKTLRGFLTLSFVFVCGIASAQIQEGDYVEDWGTGRFVVDAQSMLYVIGTQIDWREEVFGSQFEISNPNATAGSGCGESFGV